MSGLELSRKMSLPFRCRACLVPCHCSIEGWPGLEGASPKPRGFLRSAQSSPGHPIHQCKCARALDFRMSIWIFFRYVGMLLVLCGCREESSTPDVKKDSSVIQERKNDGSVSAAIPATGNPPPATTESRIRFEVLDSDAVPVMIYSNGQEAGEHAIIESLGGGVGITDIDGDGWLDIVLPRGGSLRDRSVTGFGTGLLRNRHGRFTNTSAQAGLMVPSRFNHGVAETDLDHDGFRDLLITGYGGVQLFRNLGDGTFADVTKQSGLEDPFWSSSAAWGDFNGDQCPDVYVAHYVNWSFENNPACFAADRKTRDICPPRQFEGLDDAIFLSDGAGGFLNQSQPFGLPKGGKGLAVLAADIDQDHDIDIYVSNDTVANFLLLNDAGHGFTDVSQASGTSVSDRGTPDGSMSIDLGDYNGDGLGDLWVSNYERETFAIYRNQTGSFFRHVSDVTGISAVAGKFVGWGAAFCDVDLDGDEDVLTANGHVQYFPGHAPYLQRMLLFENQNGTHFIDVGGNSPDLTVPRNGRGLSTGDLDRDGRPDMVVSQLNLPAVVFSNTSRSEDSFLNIEVIGTRSARHPVGAVVFASTALRKQWRSMKGGGSYASSFAPEAHFGIPAGQPPAVDVRWPDGTRQHLGIVEPGKRYRVIESAAAQQSRIFGLPE